jgi:hypothetical protein
MTHSRSFEPRCPSVGVRNRRAFAGRACVRGAWRWPAVTTLVASLVLTNSAGATGGGSTSVPDPAAAALFQAGREAVDKGNWSEGCPKFEASMTLYPAASTLLNMARCYEHDGKLALAWSAYQRAIIINRETQGADRKKALDDVAKKGLTDIEPRLPRLKIKTSGALPSGLRVTQNGKDVPVALLGTVIPVDPGPQSVFAEAPGFDTFSQSVTVAEGELVEITLALDKHDWTQTRGAPTWAWISGGAGVLLLTGAAVFRIDQAFVEGRQLGICQGDVEKKCPSKSVYDPTEDNSRKNRDNGLFIGLGAVGVLGLGAAIVGFVMGPPTKKKATPSAVVTPWIGPTSIGAGFGGRF